MARNDLWTADEDKILIENALLSIGELIFLLPNRTPHAIHHHTSKMGIGRTKASVHRNTEPKRWTKDVEKEFFEDIPQGYDFLKSKYNLSEHSLRIRLNKLGMSSVGIIPSNPIQKKGVPRPPLWTASDDAILIQKFDCPIGEVMSIFPNRTKHAIFQRYKKLGIKRENKS